MKKQFAFLIAAALILSIVSFAACGKTGDSVNGTEPTEEETLSAEENDAGTEAPEATEADDSALIDELKEKVVGEWGFPGDGKETDLERLTFNADGTGEYISLPSNRTLSFSYAISIDHRTYNNGEAYTENMLHMSYDTGESEDIIFFFNENGQMAFHDSDNGGYNGVMDALDVFTKYE